MSNPIVALNPKSLLGEGAIIATNNQAAASKITTFIIKDARDVSPSPSLQWSPKEY